MVMISSTGKNKGHTPAITNQLEIFARMLVNGNQVTEDSPDAQTSITENSNNNSTKIINPTKYIFSLSKPCQN